MDAKWGFAFVLACPPCTAGLFLAIGALFGLTAAVLKGTLLAGVLGVLLALWARHVWLRRGEGACRMPQPAGHE